jgi:hypothetical protein
MQTYASGLDQSFFCLHKNGNVYYLQLDSDLNIGITTVLGKDAYYGHYSFDSEQLKIEVPENNFFENSINIEGSDTFIYRFMTESLKCHGIRNQ